MVHAHVVDFLQRKKRRASEREEINKMSVQNEDGEQIRNLQ